jgi:hypothetical protein
MPSPRSKPLPLLPLVAVPAVVTLALTLLRLAGELMRWSERFFSREAGGGFAIVGIVWLVPLVGIYFALRLVRMGHAPEGRARPIGLALLGLGLVVALTGLSSKLSPLLQVFALSVSSILGAAVAFAGWRPLGRALLAYGLLARIPVVVIMLLAILGDWGTHYELGRPDLQPIDSPLLRWLVIGVVPQLGFWVPFTLLVGAIFGSIVAAAAYRRAPA